MRRVKALTHTLLAGLAILGAAECSGGGGPLENRIGEASLRDRIGPGGGTIRGAGGGPLQGLVIEVPAGAVDRLIEFDIEAGPELAEPGTIPASVGLRIRTSPDVGALRVAARVTLEVDVPEFRSGDDLLVVGRWPAGRPSAFATSGSVNTGGSEAGERATLAAADGDLDREARRYSFDVHQLTDMQVRLASERRLREDAGLLVASGYEALAGFTSSGAVNADAAFAEALRADPWDPLARLLRAISRLVVILDDRRDTTVGIDSFGELLLGLGLDVERETLLSRVRRGLWPRVLPVPTRSYTAGQIQSFVQGQLRPALEASIRDLDRVPLGTMVLVGLPELLTATPGDREVDAADLLALRGLLNGAAFAIEFLDDLELEADLVALATAARDPGLAWQEFFAAHAAFGRARRLPSTRSMDRLREALFAFEQTLAALLAETDAQGDDLLVLGSGATPDRVGRWDDALVALRESLDGGGARRIVLGGRLGSIDVDLGTPFQSGAFELAQALPAFLDSLPLAGTIPAPDLGGVLPGMTQDRATNLLGLFDRHDLSLAPIVIDGDVSEWPSAAAVLQPADPAGDVDGEAAAVDLRGVFVAVSGDALAVRIDLDSDPRPRVGQARAYTLRLRDRSRRGFGAELVMRVHLDAGTGPRVEVTRDGVLRPVDYEVALGARTLEFSVDRFDVFDPDEAPRERVLDVSSEALLESGAAARDQTRGVAVRL